MKIDLTKTIPQLPTQLEGNKNDKQASGSNFAEEIKKALDEVNDLQLEADKITNQFFAGDIQDLHQVMLATEKADLALQLTMEIRNKVIEAYKEISRMQI